MRGAYHSSHKRMILLFRKKTHGEEGSAHQFLVEINLDHALDGIADMDQFEELH
jgi:hypothetical protein